MHQAGFSPRHWRDGKAGTTIIQVFSAFYDRTKTLISDYVPAGAAGLSWSMGNAAASAGAAGQFTGLRAGQSSGKPQPSCWYRRTFQRTTGRPGAVDAAIMIDSAGAAVPSEELRAGPPTGSGLRPAAGGWSEGSSLALLQLSCTGRQPAAGPGRLPGGWRTGSSLAWTTSTLNGPPSGS
jgi:hypothetical protein